MRHFSVCLMYSVNLRYIFQFHVSTRHQNKPLLFLFRQRVVRTQLFDNEFYFYWQVLRHGSELRNNGNNGSHISKRRYLPDYRGKGLKTGQRPRCSKSYAQLRHV